MSLFSQVAETLRLDGQPSTHSAPTLSPKTTSAGRQSDDIVKVKARLEKPSRSIRSVSNVRLQRERPCDACRRRKSRCVIHEGAALCVLCEFHKQECTFEVSPLPRKRKRLLSLSGGKNMTEKPHYSLESNNTNTNEVPHERHTGFNFKGERVPLEETFAPVPPNSPELAATHTHSQGDGVTHLSMADAQTRGSSSTPQSSDTETSSTLDHTSDDYDVDSPVTVQARKECIVDRLMVRVHDIFAYTNFSTSHGYESAGSKKRGQDFDRSTKADTKQSGKKRKMTGKEEDNARDDRDEEDDDESRKRRPGESAGSKPAKGTQRRLACPYYQHNPRKCFPSRACRGPGWHTIHRIKEHIYREHAMPIHCRRCNVIFESDSDLMEHSRSVIGCETTDAAPPEGFNQDQERALKGRKNMFRAGDEEEKWKIVYLILFPDTPLGELPSPYYETQNDTANEQAENQSPKPPELKEFDAFLRRELPRKVRKELEATLKSIIGPIEETLKSELETIVRLCQETLTTDYFNNTKASAPVPMAPVGSTAQDLPKSSSSTPNSNEPTVTDFATIAPGHLSQYLVEPESAPDLLSELSEPTEKHTGSNDHVMWSDLAPFLFDDQHNETNLWPSSEPGESSLATCMTCGLDRKIHSFPDPCPFRPDPVFWKWGPKHIEDLFM